MVTEVATDENLKTAVDMTHEIVAMNQDPLCASDTLQTRVHDLFDFIASNIDVSSYHSGSPDFRVACAVASAAFSVNRERLEWKEWVAQDAKMRVEALRWPPTLPQIVIVINLVKTLLRERVKIDMHFVRECDTETFVDHRGNTRFINGWYKFYLVYGDLVRASGRDSSRDY